MSKKLRETLTLCREFGVYHFKTSDFEFHMAASGPAGLDKSPAFEPKPLTGDDLQAQLKSLADEMPSDDDMLLASSPFEKLEPGEDE